MTISGVLLYVAASIGGLGVTGAVAASFAYWIFRQFAQNWLKATFDRQLEAQKAEYQRQLERLKFQISTLMDRAVKFHAREYDVLPTAWGMLLDAYGLAHNSTSAFQQYADLERMTDAQLEDFLSKSELPSYQQDELREPMDRNKRYQEIRFWVNYNKARNSLADYNNYTLKSGIFIEPTLEKAMLAVSRRIFETLIDSEYVHNYPRSMDKKWSDISEAMNSISKEIDSIKITVQARLWDTKLTSDL